MNFFIEVAEAKKEEPETLLELPVMVATSRSRVKTAATVKGAGWNWREIIKIVKPVNKTKVSYLLRNKEELYIFPYQNE